MRLFSAVLPSAAALMHLAAAVDDVRDGQLRWTELSAWHITLAFYGEIAEERVPELTDRLTRAARRHPAMQLQLQGCGRFSHSVLWVGVTGDVQPLRHLASSAAAAGRKVGARDSARRFRPHVTLARARGRDDDLRPYVASFESYAGPAFAVSDVELVRSHLRAGPGGRARYETVARFPLGQSAPPTTG